LFCLCSHLILVDGGTICRLVGRHDLPSRREGTMQYVAALLLLVTNTALACDTYTSTRKPAGERVLVDNGLELTLRETGKAQSFWTGSAGTGSAIQVAHPRDGSAPMQVVRKQGEFWLADERFVEFCQTIAAPDAAPAPDLGSVLRAWLYANHTCNSGDDHYGVKTGEDDIKAACAEAVALQELLEQGGYCDDPASGWRLCAADPYSADAVLQPGPAIVVVPPATFPVDPRFESWTVASRICLDGEDADGIRVSEEKADAACAATIAILEDLENDGYCRAPDGLDWVNCD